MKPFWWTQLSVECRGFSWPFFVHRDRCSMLMSTSDVQVSVEYLVYKMHKNTGVHGKSQITNCGERKTKLLCENFSVRLSFHESIDAWVHGLCRRVLIKDLSILTYHLLSNKIMIDLRIQWISLVWSENKRFRIWLFVRIATKVLNLKPNFRSFLSDSTEIQFQFKVQSSKNDVS